MSRALFGHDAMKLICYQNILIDMQDMLDVYWVLHNLTYKDLLQIIKRGNH